MDWTSIILSLLTLLLGSGNLVQFVQMRELKRKSSAEAYQLEIDSLRKIIESNQKEIARLSTNYGELQDKYFRLAEEVQDLRVTTKQ